MPTTALDKIISSLERYPVKNTCPDLNGVQELKSGKDCLELVSLGVPTLIFHIPKNKDFYIDLYALIAAEYIQQCRDRPDLAGYMYAWYGTSTLGLFDKSKEPIEEITNFGFLYYESSTFVKFVEIPNPEEAI